MAFLELSGIQKQFPGGNVAVEHFQLAVDKGEFVSFLGPSGCGKTTTLRMIAGFERPTAGSIKIDGREITNQPPNQRNIGMVFQSYALFPNMTAAGNIGFGLKVRKRPADAIAKKVDELLELIHLSGRGGKYPYELSGGMQQRASLCRALLLDPPLLLMDEPFGALDAMTRDEMNLELLRVWGEGSRERKTIVFVTHSIPEAAFLADRVVVMTPRPGRLGRVLDVALPRPRTVASRAHPDFGALTLAIHESLR